jgi:hypothetical protein
MNDNVTQCVELQGSVDRRASVLNYGSLLRFSNSGREAKSARGLAQSTTWRQCARFMGNLELHDWTRIRTLNPVSPSPALRAPSPPLGESDGARGAGSWYCESPLATP